MAALMDLCPVAKRALLFQIVNEHGFSLSLYPTQPKPFLPSITSRPQRGHFPIGAISTFPGMLTVEDVLILSTDFRTKSSMIVRYREAEISPRSTCESPFSQEAVILGLSICGTVSDTISNKASPIDVGVMSWVFLFREMYLSCSSFVMISALVADVPIPLPLICSRSSASSISFPAPSIHAPFFQCRIIGFRVAETDKVPDAPGYDPFVVLDIPILVANHTECSGKLSGN